VIKRGGQWVFGNMISQKNNFTREYTGAENKSPRDMEWADNEELDYSAGNLGTHD